MHLLDNKKGNFIDPNIKVGYDKIMMNYRPQSIIKSNWEKIGENYKQFSLYDNNYKTRVTNKI